MNSLSVAVSVFTILEIVTQIIQNFAKIRIVHHVFFELLSFMNEISNFRTIISQVATFSNQLKKERFKNSIMTLKSHLDKTTDSLRFLKVLINTKLFKLRIDETIRISRTI